MIMYKDRINAITKYMDENAIDILIISAQSNIFYLTGFEGGLGLIFDLDRVPYLLVPRLDFERASYISNIENIVALTKEKAEFLPSENIFIGDLIDFIEKLASNKRVKIGLEKFSIGFKNYIRLKEEFGEKNLIDISPLVRDMRITKSMEEIQLIKNAINISEKAFQYAIDLIKPGVKECEVAGEIEYFMRKMGCRPAFETIVASGKFSAFPHGFASEKRIESGDIIVIDFGARYKGYVADITRTVFVKPISSRKRELLRMVMEAQEKAIDVLGEGIDICEPDKIVREMFREKNYLAFYNHSTGHGIGIDVHEPPRLYFKAEGKFKNGMIVTVEPGIYIPGYGGIRVEDDVLITSEGHRVLSSLEKEYIL